MALQAQRMKDVGFSIGKRYVLQNRHFQEKCEKSSKNAPKSSQNPPKILPESWKIDPKSIQKAFWTPFLAHVGKKVNLEHQKNDPKAPRSAHKTAQTGPNPSQMEPKTLPNPLFRLFRDSFFSFQNLH